MRHTLTVLTAVLFTLFCLFNTSQAFASEKTRIDQPDPAPSSAKTQSTASSGTDQQAPKNINKEYRYIEGQASPQIKETFTDENGNTYKLISSDSPIIDPSYEHPSQSYTKQITKEIPLEDAGALDAYFPASLLIEDGVFMGAIGLSADPYSTQNVYESYTGQVDRAYTLYGLPDNDASRLPTHMDFQVSSDASFGATTTTTLELLDVAYEVASTNSLGLPNNYTAYLVYRGQESWLAIHHYVVTATYAGSISSAEEGYLITSHYQLVPAPVTPEITVPAVAMTTVPIPMAAPLHFTPPMISAAVIVVFILALLLVWLIFLRKNITLTRITSTGSQVLFRKHLRVQNNMASLEIPPTVELNDHASYLLELKPTLANRTGQLVVVWREQTVVREHLKDAIQIDLDALVAKAVVQTIGEELIGISATSAKA